MATARSDGERAACATATPPSQQRELGSWRWRREPPQAGAQGADEREAAEERGRSDRVAERRGAYERAGEGVVDGPDDESAPSRLREQEIGARGRLGGDDFAAG